MKTFDKLRKELLTCVFKYIKLILKKIFFVFLDMKKNLQSRHTFRQRLPVIFCHLAPLVSEYINPIFKHFS